MRLAVFVILLLTVLAFCLTDAVYTLGKTVGEASCPEIG